MGRGRELSCYDPKGQGTTRGDWNCSLHTIKDPQRAPPLSGGWEREKLGDNKDAYLDDLEQEMSC